MSVIWTDDKRRRDSDQASILAWMCLVLGAATAAVIVAFVMWIGDR